MSGTKIGASVSQAVPLMAGILFLATHSAQAQTDDLAPFFAESSAVNEHATSVQPLTKSFAENEHEISVQPLDKAPSIDSTMPRFAAERVDSGRSHLWQSIAWGGASVIGGAALALTSDREQHPTRWAFGVQSAAWGSIDIGIGAIGLIILRGPPSGRDRADLIDRERLYHDALVFSMGLDIAYMTAGTLMTVASYRGVDNALEWRGHGTAIIIQGAALCTIEAIAWLGSRGRLKKLIELTPQIAAGNSDGSFSVSLGGRF